MIGYSNLEEFKKKSGYEIDGIWYPRVTKIISIKSKPALHFFYAGLNNYAEGEKIKQISADEGTRIHQAAQAMFLNKTPIVDNDIEPSIIALEKFLHKNRIEVESESIEARVVNEDERYAGTVDAIAKIGGKIGVLDIKTSQAIYRDYNLQTSAYMAGLSKKRNDIATRWILRIDQHQVCKFCGALLRSKGGREKVKIDWNNPRMRSCEHIWGPIVGEVEIKEFPEWEEDFKGFLGAKRLWEWENKDWLKQIGYL